MLPSYFNCMIPELPNTCNRYELRKPLFRLPLIKHKFAEQSLHYCLIKQLNRENGYILTTSKVHTHSFYGSENYIKANIIQSYNDHCAIINCYICQKNISIITINIIETSIFFYNEKFVKIFID